MKKIICPSCFAEADSDKGWCDGCGLQFTGASTPTIPTTPVRRPKSQAELGLAFLIDRTGSSKQFATGIQLFLKLILEAIVSKVRSTKVSVLTYGDLDEGQDMVLLMDRGSPDQALNDAKGIAFSRGGSMCKNK